MRVFVYEYACCQSETQPLAKSVRTEGRAMLSAIREDLAALDGVTVETMPVVAPSDEERLFRELAARADRTLVIAPEFDNLLLTRCRWVIEAGGRLLGPEPNDVRLIADKLALAH